MQEQRKENVENPNCPSNFWGISEEQYNCSSTLIVNSEKYGADHSGLLLSASEKADFI